jgi:hypothetical protein
MTPNLEATLRAALERATPLPWYTLDPPWLPGGEETSILAESPDPHVARFICDFDLWALDDDDRKSENPDADAALIVAAVNALPTLLDTLTALRAQVEGLRRNADAWVSWYELADAGDDCEYLNGNGWPDAEALASTTMGLLASLKQESSRG